MKFSKRKPCVDIIGEIDTIAGYSGEAFVEHIEVLNGNWTLVGNIYFTKSGKPRYVDAQSVYDYTPSQLKQILAKMES